MEARIRHLEHLQIQFEADQSQARDNLRQAKAEAGSSPRTAAEIRRQAALLYPTFADPESAKVVTPDGTGEGKEGACHVLDGFVRKHIQDISERLATQLAFDRRTGNVRDRHFKVPLPAVTINGLSVPVESLIQYRAADTRFEERVSDPEIRYSFKFPNTDLWKSGNITTGRGLVESVTRKVAELPDDAAYRDRIAETKRRQTVELTGLQGRPFTHEEELAEQRRRLEHVMVELAKSSTSGNADRSEQAA